MEEPMQRIAPILIFLCLLAAPAHAASLWSQSGGSLFTDFRAAKVGDVVSILVTENSKSDRQAETNLKKESDNNLNISNIFGNSNPKWGQFTFTGSNEQKSNGNITRTDVVTASIPARVMRVLDNGYLVIEGRRVIAVNDENQVLAFSGIVRPQDIRSDNTVLSSQVADAEITMVGRGVLADKQRPGILNRIFDIFRIF
jgi:flagellar L-ring protein precursor FlgH